MTLPRLCERLTSAGCDSPRDKRLKPGPVGSLRPAVGEKPKRPARLSTSRADDGLTPIRTLHVPSHALCRSALRAHRMIIQEVAMLHLPMIDVMRRAIRERVCTGCFMRPAGSEQLGPNVPRECERACTVFVNLVPLRKIAAAMEARDGSPGLFERAIRDSVCARCSHAVASGGDYCAEHLAETCPL